MKHLQLPPIHVAAYIKTLITCLPLFGFIVTSHASNESPITECHNLTLNFSSKPTSRDPHTFDLRPNLNLFSHTHETLFLSDIAQNTQPALAEKWEIIDPLTWKITLKQNVLFHDGTEFTSKDVLYSFNRVLSTSAQKGYGQYLKAIDNLIALDDYTIMIKTKYPHPELVQRMSNIFITKHASEDKKESKDDNNNILIGTGLYRFTDNLEDFNNISLRIFKQHRKYNDNYFKNANIVYTADQEKSIAAFLSGEIDILDSLLPDQITEIRKSAKKNILQAPSLRLIMYQFDTNRNITPFAFDKEGNPLKDNPFKSRLVRKAINHAINRQLLVDEELNGVGEITGQLVPNVSFSRTPSIKPIEHNVTLARELMAKAGYEDGFALTIHTTNDRYIKDKEITQRVALMLKDINIDATVIDLPKAEYFDRYRNNEFSMMILGWRSQAARVEDALEPLLMTYDAEKFEGIYNGGRYSNPKLDSIIRQARTTFDPVQGLKLLRYATEIALQDYPIAPLYFQPAIYAYSKHIDVPDPNKFGSFYNAQNFICVSQNTQPN